MKVIEKFTIGAVNWKVEVDNKRNDDREAYGYCNFDTSTITIQDKSNGVNRDESAVQQTTYHEVVHAILDTMSEYELSKNEKFVQSFSLLLHQFEQTKK